MLEIWTYLRLSVSPPSSRSLPASGLNQHPFSRLIKHLECANLTVSCLSTSVKEWHQITPGTSNGDLLSQLCCGPPTYPSAVLVTAFGKCFRL